jgi:hypothetical protein
MMSFTRGVARRVLAELNRKVREVPVEEAPRVVYLAFAQQRDGQDLDRCLACVEESLRQLDADDRELILHWYQYDKSEKIQHRRQLAAARGVSAETLRVQVYRARQHVHKLVQKCLKSSRIQ